MRRVRYKWVLLIAIISTLSISSFCQSPNKAGINLGYGIWDGLHAGALYRMNRYSAGLDLGWMEGFHPLWNGRNLMVVMNNNYYLRKKNESSNKETLIFLNPTYLNYEDLHMINQIIFINAGLGREISLGRSFSLGYQGGPILPVYAKRKRKTDIEDQWAAVPILVNLRLRVTYKIGRELNL
jgi:hypothetical protein